MKEDCQIKMPVKYNFNLDLITNEKIKRKSFYTLFVTYLIINYDKNCAFFDEINMGLYRSIIFSYPSKEVVCFSPPKSISQSIFSKKYPVIDESIWINETIEGITINLFYDKQVREWQIATKSSIGGKYWFYGKSKSNTTQPTFLEMFLDALKAPIEQDLNDVVLLQQLPKEYCYNFVLQHPSNTITVAIDRCQLYLIGVYKINMMEVEYISQYDYESWNVFCEINGVILFPKRFIVDSYNDLPSEIINKGYMITNMNTGERTKIKNKHYEDLKTILAIKPEIQYQFLCINRIGSDKVNEYLTHFPKMRKDFYLMRYLLDQFMKNVHLSYLSKYIFRDNKPILEKYDSHVYKIHRHYYLSGLKKNRNNKKIKVEYNTVVDYFNKMEPRELFYILNGDARMEKL
jgi:hypothetical protein